MKTNFDAPALSFSYTALEIIFSNRYHATSFDKEQQHGSTQSHHPTARGHGWQGVHPRNARHGRHGSRPDRRRSQRRRNPDRLPLPGARRHHAGASLRGMARRRTRGHAGHSMKLLVDMNLSPRWVDVLADAGIEAAHWSAVGAFTPRTQKSWPMSVRTTAWCSLTIWISARSSLPPTVKSRAWCRFARRMSARTRSASKSSLPCDKWLPNLKKVRCSWSIRTARDCACCHCNRGDEGR